MRIVWRMPNKLLGDVAYHQNWQSENQHKIEKSWIPIFRSTLKKWISSNRYIFLHDLFSILGARILEKSAAFSTTLTGDLMFIIINSITRFDSDVCAKYVLYYMSKFFGLYTHWKILLNFGRFITLANGFQNFVIRFPPTLGEQEAIVEVLSDMDAEIPLWRNALRKPKPLSIKA